MKEKKFSHWKVASFSKGSCLNFSSTKPIFNEACSKFIFLKTSPSTRHFSLVSAHRASSVHSINFQTRFSRKLFHSFFNHFLAGCTSSCGTPCMRVLSTRINLRTVTLSILFASRGERVPEGGTCVEAQQWGLPGTGSCGYNRNRWTDVPGSMRDYLFILGPKVCPRVGLARYAYSIRGDCHGPPPMPTFHNIRALASGFSRSNCSDLLADQSCPHALLSNLRSRSWISRHNLKSFDATTVEKNSFYEYNALTRLALATGVRGP